MWSLGGERGWNCHLAGVENRSQLVHLSPPEHRNKEAGWCRGQLQTLEWETGHERMCPQRTMCDKNSFHTRSKSCTKIYNYVSLHHRYLFLTKKSPALVKLLSRFSDQNNFERYKTQDVFSFWVYRKWWKNLLRVELKVQAIKTGCVYRNVLTNRHEAWCMHIYWVTPRKSGTHLPFIAATAFEIKLIKFGKARNWSFAVCGKNFKHINPTLWKW